MKPSHITILLWLATIGCCSISAGYSDTTGWGKAFNFAGYALFWYIMFIYEEKK